MLRNCALILLVILGILLAVPKQTDAAETSAALPSVDQTVLKKSYFVGGGAFWFIASLTKDGEMTKIVPELDEYKICMSRDEFVARTHFTVNDLKLVTDEEICVTR